MKNSYYLFIALLFVIVPGITNSQTLQENLYVTNGSVKATKISGNTLYIGGDFTQVGPSTGYGAAIDTSTGTYDPSMPKVNGAIYAIAPDGLGGWFIGGTFTYVGAVARNKIAHIKADKTVDMSWNPNATGSTFYPPYIKAIAVSGSTVYVGGQFTNIGGLARNRIAALDFTTGAATTWNPNASFPATAVVYAIAVSGSTVYAGGTFTKIGTTVRNNIAAIGTSGTGTLTIWNPNAGGRVNAIAISGSTVYAGGLFTTIGGQTRNRIAAVDITTGLATTWNPNSDANVFTLAVSGSTVYAGGQFSNIGGQARKYIAALDSTTPGLATSWNPDANATGYVNILAVSGSTVYAGGDFTSIGGQTRNYTAAFDISGSGLATSWNPSAGGTVSALAVSGATVYAGGNFTTINGQARNRIAALDITSGAPTSWNPDANSTVVALAVSGSTVYAAGNFATIGGQTRNRIAALDITSGTSTSWNPDAGGTVYTLAVSGSTVYAGGIFTTIGGQSRNNLAALDITTGLATTWNPDASSAVYTLAVSGSTVYGGGDFTSIGGQVRNYIAALDITTGLATSWDPNVSAGGQVRALAVSGSTVYAGGYFTTIGGQARNYIAALDITTGLATTWDATTANNIVYDIAVSDLAVYAGGAFTTIGGQTRNKIAGLDITTGLATTWNPNANGVVNTISLDFTNGRIYAGGDFTTVMNSPYSYLAGLTNPDDPLPVELTSFTANILSTGIELKWQTATEVNNYGFEVQRTIKNEKLEITNFETIGFVEGNGNSNSPKEYSFIDESVKNGKYSYRLKQIDFNGKFSYSDEVEVELYNIPTEFALYQNYPNPFNPSTTIKYALPSDSKVILEVYNIVGQKVTTLINNESKEVGYHEVSFNASSAAGGLSSGIYIYKITTDNFTSTKKFVFMK
ncbi:MAG: T9SS type A sorting domain-containing protein [Ignavibacteria bacterium]|nr:T9SS type A sorting domain-containing protein [Ignavibacteria bacterium]